LPERNGEPLPVPVKRPAAIATTTGDKDMSDDVSTEELSDEELDVQLREVADKSIDPANPQAQRFHKENVSQGMM
jgi:hypothetical protein